MKIIHIIFSLETGGTETMLVDIINEQVKTESVSLIIVNKGFKNHIVEKIHPRVEIIKINRKPSSRNPIPLLKINYYLLQSKPDIIHFHNVNGIGLVLPYFRKKAVLTIHAMNVQYSFFAKYKKLFAISKAVKQDIFMRYGLETTLVYDGIYTSNVNVKQNRNANFQIVQIGRLRHHIKGQNLLIKAIEQLVYEYGYTNIQLDFIGEGPSLSFLKQLVRDCKLENHITFLGNKSRDYVYQYLCDYDLLIQPSINEGFGLTVVEGMSAKIPVLVSDIEGPMEIIENGKYGYYFKTENVNDLIEKIMHIITHYNNENNMQMIENAYQHVITKFDIKKTAVNYLREYN
jgi:glycosyltransferase involved in cell wall biosynthesis